jgi:dTDP-4-dehydrorhamnose reductase
VDHSFEIWASPEPTVARITAATWRDQLAETGHQEREGDIALLAGLGISASRYPVLWEKHAERDPARIDFAWARRRLEELRARGVEPVVTLLHHGSGPAYTSLVDPEFPALFARYAGAVAREFPWVRRWTPINEPLTTARFSALYGHWYPNGRDDHAAFGRAVTNEALAMLLGMEAIREHAPGAQFVVTEDLQSFTSLHPETDAFVAHKRERSFLSIELVMGRVRPGHALYGYLTERCGIEPSRLRAIAESACAPDLIGWNYYPNSERTLDLDARGEIRNRPSREIPAAANFDALAAPGGEAFAGQISPRPLLEAAYERLGVPFGLGEVHINASEAGRVRWLAQRYGDLAALERAGLPVRMLGSWAVFGMVDWDSLLTRHEGYREDGAFTFAAAGQTPQPTALAAAVRALARGEALVPEGPPEWWETGGEPAPPQPASQASAAPANAAPASAALV